MPGNCGGDIRLWIQQGNGISKADHGYRRERCCESDLECLLIGREERVRLHELGMQLGSLDKKQETQIFLQYAEFLEEKRGGLLKEIQEKRRLCNLLGVTAGLFLTILIL